MHVNKTLRHCFPICHLQVDLANQGLEDETRRAMRLKEESSVWRLHLVIVGLSVLLFLLILMGLS